MSEKPYKEQVMQNLRLLQDDPDLSSPFFQFKKFAQQLQQFILDPNTPTPYTIGLHGEWGSGKTSLIYRVYKHVEDNLPNNWKVIWFDAWKYERLDPTLALMQRIADQYHTKAGKFKQVVKGILRLSSDFVLRTATGIELEAVEKEFEDTVKSIPTINEELSKMVGDGRLVVFIDDLDRCIVENALSILEAIKLFLTVKGTIFVVAVDMHKLERAWMLRYKGSSTGMQEGREHVDKIFQLKLSLPPKGPKEFEQFLKTIAESLPDRTPELIIKGCTPNPRKIKRVLNLIYFLAKSIEDTKFKEYFPAVAVWSIATTIYPELSQKIISNPNSIVQMALITYHLDEIETLYSRIEKIKRVIPDRQDVNISRLPGSKLTINHEHLLPSTVEGLEYVVKNPSSFSFLKTIADYYSIIVANEVPENLNSTLDKHYAKLGKTINEVIYKGGLVA